MNVYLNRNFFQILQNLKADKSNCVTEFLEGIHVSEAAPDALGLMDEFVELPG